MGFISVTIPRRSGEPVSVTGEQVTEHFAITPALLMSPDGEPGLADGLALTHIPTGRVITHSTWVDMRRFARELETLDIDWSDLALLNEEQAMLVRAAFRRVEPTGNDPLPWAAWAGDKSTPASSLLAYQLDAALESQKHTDPLRDIEAAVRKLDPELAQRLHLKAITMYCGNQIQRYSIAYLLAVLQRIDPVSADRAAHDLVAAVEMGEGLLEWMYQWRSELAGGQPLTLHGFPDLPIGTPSESIRS